VLLVNLPPAVNFANVFKNKKRLENKKTLKNAKKRDQNKKNVKIRFYNYVLIVICRSAAYRLSSGQTDGRTDGRTD